MVIDVSGNVGIGESNPTKALEVAGDISFNGNLYQNGSLFQSGSGNSNDVVSYTTISSNETTDISWSILVSDNNNNWPQNKVTSTPLIHDNTMYVWYENTLSYLDLSNINTSWNSVTAPQWHGNFLCRNCLWRQINFLWRWI